MFDLISNERVKPKVEALKRTRQRLLPILLPRGQRPENKLYYKIQSNLTASKLTKKAQNQSKKLTQLWPTFNNAIA